jgi:DNA-binding transcriptional regulator YbjK
VNKLEQPSKNVLMPWFGATAHFHRRFHITLLCALQDTDGNGSLDKDEVLGVMKKMAEAMGEADSIPTDQAELDAVLTPSSFSGSALSSRSKAQSSLSLAGLRSYL